MEHRVVVVRITLMTMQEPVARLVVDLHITYPQCTTDFHLRIEEVRAGIKIMQTRVDDLHRLAVGGVQSLQRIELVLPAIVQ